MSENSFRTLDRTGAAAGFVFVLLFVGLIMFAPHLPAPDHSIAEITRTAREDATGILVGVYLSLLLTGALLVFGAVIVARLWRTDARSAGWSIVALGGLAVAAVPDDAVARFVRAVQYGASGEALFVGYPVSLDGVLMAVPLAVFLLGVGAGASEALPRWLSRFALVLSASFVAGAGGVAFDEFGGPLGPVMLFAYVGLFVWITSASVVLWRRQQTAPVAAPVTAS
jgi:hypothetical protein